MPNNIEVEKQFMEIREGIAKTYKKDCKDCTRKSLSPCVINSGEAMPKVFCGDAGTTKICVYQHFKADSLLRTVLASLKIDTGELMDFIEIDAIKLLAFKLWESSPDYKEAMSLGELGYTLRRDLMYDQSIAKASRAKFIEIGELMK